MECINDKNNKCEKLKELFELNRGCLFENKKDCFYFIERKECKDE